MALYGELAAAIAGDEHVAARQYLARIRRDPALFDAANHVLELDAELKYVADEFRLADTACVNEFLLRSLVPTSDQVASAMASLERARQAFNAAEERYIFRRSLDAAAESSPLPPPAAARTR